jgi:hypothetical protein
MKVICLFYSNAMHRVITLRLGALLAVVTASLVAVSFTGPDIDEYQVKATFVVNFAKYVDWSTNATENDFAIGIVGPSEITAPLEKLADGRKVNARNMKVLQWDPVKPAPCNILFVAHSESWRLPRLAKDFAGKGVLLVSEDNLRPSPSAGINLIKEENRIKFEINQAAVKQAGLRLSAQLQLLASALRP